MRERKIGVSILLLFVLFLSLFAVFPVGTFAVEDTQANADNAGQAEYKQKIVSVVFDNSGSMNSSVSSQNKTTRFDVAVYSLRILMSLLNEDDIMYIAPMNGTTGKIQVDLKNENRTNAIDDVVKKLKQTNSYTPPDTIGRAVGFMTDHGLKTDAELKQSSEEVLNDLSKKEFWLVILTDGKFETKSDQGTDSNILKKPSYQAGKVVEQIEDYTDTVRTVYLGFTDDSIDLLAHDEGKNDYTGAQNTLVALKNAQTFHSYPKISAVPSINDPNDIIDVMQDVANKISGRYSLPDSAYSVAGNQVTIDLSAKDVKFSLSSISVILQNSNASLTGKIKYVEGNSTKELTPENMCKISPGNLQSMKPGCSFKISAGNNAYFSKSGKLILTFENASDLQEENITIIAEPALKLTYKLMYAGKAITPEEITKTLKDADPISVSAEVIDLGLSKAVEGVTLETKINYCDTVYRANDAIPLQFGNNKLRVMVAADQAIASYSLSAETYILVNKSDSVFTVKGTNKTVEDVADAVSVDFAVTLRNKNGVDVTNLSGCTFTPTVTGPSGNSVTAKVTKGTSSVTVTLNIPQDQPGQYTVKLEGRAPAGVTGTVEATAVASCTVTYKTPGVTVTPIDKNGNTLSKTETKDVSKPIELFFEVCANGKPISNLSEDMLLLQVTGKNASLDASKFEVEKTENGRVTVSVDLSSEDVGSYTVTLIVKVYGKEAKGSCTIEYQSPAFFLQAPSEQGLLSGGQTGMTVPFTVHMEGNMVKDAAKLAGYTFKATVNGKEQNVSFDDASDCLPVAVDLSGSPEGDYAVVLKAYRAGKEIASTTYTVTYQFSSLQIESEGDDTVDKNSKDFTVCFTVSVDGNPATKEDGVFRASIKVIAFDGTEAEISLGELFPDEKGQITVQYEVTQQGCSYRVKLLAETSQGVTAEKTHSVEYLPSGLDLIVTDGGVDGNEDETLLLITENQLLNNDGKYGLTFTVFNKDNGRQFPLDNGTITYELILDGQKVDQQYFAVSGGTLTLFPTAESLGGSSTGSRALTLTVRSSQYPQLNAEISATVEIKNTAWTVVWLEDVGNPDVKRFALDASNAVLYFTVKRDGIPLTFEELEQEYKNIDVDAPSFFGFFSPAGIQTSVEESDGKAVLAVRVVRDIRFKYYAWHAAAFLFKGGDKNITVGYNAEDAVDAKTSFHVVKSNPLIHVWRILHLIINLAIYVYLILYTIGFFVAKKLPRGTYVKISNRGKVEFSDVNRSVGDLLRWHLLIRTNPVKLFQNQDPNDLSQTLYAPGVVFGRKKLKKGEKNCIVVTPDGKCVLYRMQKSPRFELVFKEIRGKAARGERVDIAKLTNNNFKQLSDLFLNPVGQKSIGQNTHSSLSSGLYYGVYKRGIQNGVETWTMQCAFTFIEHSK